MAEDVQVQQDPHQVAMRENQVKQVQQEMKNQEQRVTTRPKES